MNNDKGTYASTAYQAPTVDQAFKGVAQIPEAKQQEMIDYAKKLRAKFPHMKKERIMRKTAEYFKVKLT